MNQITKMITEIRQRIERAIDERFGTKIPVAAGQPGSESLVRLLEHRSHRRYAAQPVSAELLRLLFACALSSPSKSDLQQADIVHVADAAKRKVIADLIPDMPWVREAPAVAPRRHVRVGGRTVFDHRCVVDIAD